jgi:hypothetical protein
LGNKDIMKGLSIVLTLAAALNVAAVAHAYAPPPMQQPDQPQMPGAPPPMQPMPTTTQQPPYVDTSCGSWQGDAWVSNGSCSGANYRHQIVAGTITNVSGHLVTLTQAKGTVVIDDSRALNDQSTGPVAVGRQIIAHGYWQGRNFYATAITSGQPPP